MKTAGFVFAAILSAVIMFGTVMAVANAGMAAGRVVVGGIDSIVSTRALSDFTANGTEE